MICGQSIRRQHCPVFLQKVLMHISQTSYLIACHTQATKEDFAYRHAHSKMTQNFRVNGTPLSWPGLVWLISLLCTLHIAFAAAYDTAVPIIVC